VACPTGGYHSPPKDVMVGPVTPFGYNGTMASSGWGFPGPGPNVPGQRGISPCDASGGGLGGGETTRGEWRATLFELKQSEPDTEKKPARAMLESAAARGPK